MKTIFFILSFFLASNGQNVGVISKLVHDLLENENIPSYLSVIACWSQSENFDFVQRSKVPIQLSNSFNTITRRIIDDKMNKLWYFIDMRCNGSSMFLHRIEDVYFAQPYRWILFEPIEDILTNLTFLTDSNVVLINFNSNSSQFNLKQGNPTIL